MDKREILKAKQQAREPRNGETLLDLVVDDASVTLSLREAMVLKEYLAEGGVKTPYFSEVSELVEFVHELFNE